MGRANNLVKQCCTCAYWTGKRTIDKNGVDYSDSKAKCGVAPFGTITNATSGCVVSNKFQKHPLLSR